MPNDVVNADGVHNRKNNFLSSYVLEMCVLSLMLRNDAYGYEIAKLNKLQVSESTIYPVLRRLNANGYLETYTQQHNARLRKVYSFTPSGAERLNELKCGWHEFVDNVNHLLEENK
jgi:PadR family transcriptional regulator PadR